MSIIDTVFGFISHLGAQGVLAACGTIATTFITPYIVQFLHLSAQDTRRSYLQDAVSKALVYGISVVAKHPETEDLIEVKDDVIAIAKAYLRELTPQALNKLDIHTDAQLEQLLEAALASGLDNLSALLGSLIARNKSVATKAAVKLLASQAK